MLARRAGREKPQGLVADPLPPSARHGRDIAGTQLVAPVGSQPRVPLPPGSAVRLNLATSRPRKSATQAAPTPSRPEDLRPAAGAGLAAVIGEPSHFQWIFVQPSPERRASRSG
jgi:hypothetical protein